MAMPRGPVASSTLDISYDKNDFDRDYTAQYISKAGINVNSKNEVDTDYLSQSEIEAMDIVWERFKHMNEFQLEKLSHEYPEWKRYESLLLDKTKKSSYPMVIDDFFKAPANKSAAMYDFFEGLEPHIESSKEVLQRRAILAG